MAEKLAFTGHTVTDLEVVRELLAGVPPGARLRAKSAAAQIERTYMGIVRNHPKDPAVGLGLAFAIFTIAERLTQGDPERGQEKGLIQLLS
jgi:hypothetical protein